MRFALAVAALSAYSALVAARHARPGQGEHKRQVTLSHSQGGTTATATATIAISSSLSAATSSASAAPGTGTGTSAALSSVPSPAASGVPPLQSITFGMPTGTTLPVTATFAAGAKPTFAGAPALPTPYSPQVLQWMQELNGFDIPDLAPTTDGSCVNDTSAASDAQNRGWWTCGGWTRPTDIVSCPDKYTWGVSFDDGPSPYTTKLLGYLTQKDLHATFFVVGSRVIGLPQVLVEQYMTGHEISVHTWSHPHLTSLTNQQIVAELGWTREAIKAVLGVTPTTMRPPYGDIDDRVRAISLAMGLVPVIWTRTPSAGQFDTNDWQVAGGVMTPTQQFSSFQSILGNASLINTGIIVLEHDLYEITVDLAIGYTINAALTHNPPFTLKPIGQCSNIPTSNLYVESNTNSTFPYKNHTTASNNEADGKSTTEQTSAASNGLISPFTPFLAICWMAAIFALASYTF